MVLFLRAYLPLRLPEIWRQMDTLGVSYRYWMRWTLEPWQWTHLLPAILNSGDSAGFQAMELPLLNLISAPCFASGSQEGILLAQWLLLVLIFVLLIANLKVWEGQRIGTIPAELMVASLPIYSLGGVWSGKFMPDFPAFLLVLWSVGESWEARRPLRSFLLAATGLLLKPTSALTLGLLALQPGKAMKKLYHPWAVGALAVALLYYTAGISALQMIQIGPSRFAVNSISLNNVLILTEWPERFWNLLYKEVFFPGAPIFFGVAYAAMWVKSREKPPLSLWGLLLTGLLLTAGLTGAQGYSHPYYFLGVVPISSLIFLDLWKRSPHPVFRFVLAMALLLFVLEHANLEVRPWLRLKNDPHVFALSQCKRLIAEHPEFPWGKNHVFRSTEENYPELGLCFGEREGSKSSAYGFFWKGTLVPPGCQAVGESESIWLVRCGD